MSSPNKTQLLRIYLWLLGIFLVFWWPLSHWLYPQWYHTLLGFESYDDAMVKVIGTSSLIPVLCVFLAASNPRTNRSLLMILIASSVAMALTYLYLIVTQAFPNGEYLNVALLGVNTLILLILFPRGDAPESN